VIATYRNQRAYGFCPGCSHRLILDALDRALVRLQWDPARVVIVTDIGCVGLSDQHFITSAFHGLHGRSLTYATGIKLARPDLHVIVLIGDGGCGIGCAHLVSAARRNIGITTLVFNNFNFGMTGGEHSVTTPEGRKTVTTPWGNTELPLDIAQTVAINGATHVWRGSAFDPELDAQILAALQHDGFALLDIWELCVAYFASLNRLNPRMLKEAMVELGMAEGLLRHETRPEASRALREVWASRRGLPLALKNPIPVHYAPRLDHAVSLVIAGSAGAHIRTAGRMAATAAMLAGLWALQRDDYPVTVRSGHSVSEVVLAPTRTALFGTVQTTAVVVLSSEGLDKVHPLIRALGPDSWLFGVPALIDDVHTDAQMVRLSTKPIPGVTRSNMALAATGVVLARLGWAPAEALIEAASLVSPEHADVNREAVAHTLDHEGLTSDVPPP